MWRVIPIWRLGILGLRVVIRTDSSFGSIASLGITARPIPAPASPWTTPFSSERKTKCGSRPVERELVDDDLRRAAVAEADQRLLGDLAQRGHVPGPRRSPSRRRAQEHVVVLEHEARLEPRVLERKLDEREVELATLDEVGEDAVGVGLAELDLDGRPGAREPAHHLRQDLGADALEDADVERTGLAGRERAEIGLGRLQPRDDRPRVAEEQPSRLGERNRARAARPLDQPLADDPLERRDLLADRRTGCSRA